MTRSTEVAQTIITNITLALATECVSYPEVMMDCILTDAQELVNEKGYAWDVALTISAKSYPATQYAGIDAYSA